MPDASPLHLHIISAFGEHEAKAISELTIAALAAYKARGRVLGSQRPGAPQLSLEARRAGAKARRDAAMREHAAVAIDLRRRREAGASLRELAAYCTDVLALQTKNEKPWSTAQVWRVLRYA